MVDEREKKTEGERSDSVTNSENTEQNGIIPEDGAAQNETNRSAKSGEDDSVTERERGQEEESEPGTGKGGGGVTEPPPLDFSGFVLSLGESALIDLGVTPHPVTGKTGQQLPQARQTIDILALLNDKTQGNLTADEAKLLSGLLYQLRLVFVENN